MNLTGGTCPGDGRCDGTGGSSACAGCPTYNNALAVSARLAPDLDVSASQHQTTSAPVGVRSSGSPSIEPALPNTEVGSPDAAGSPGRTKVRTTVGALS